MKREELSQYLRRIGIDGEIEPSVEGLAAVQRAHLRTVPFENLDIVEGKIPLALDERSLSQSRDPLEAARLGQIL